MRKLILLCVLLVVGYTVSAQFPTTDSLRNYNTRYTTNSAINWFTNLRGQTLLRGMIDWIDSAKLGIAGSVGVDTVFTINDSTLRYRKNGSYHNVVIRGASGIGVDSIYIRAAEATGTRIFHISGDTLKLSNLVAGSNITLTKNADSSITIAASGGGGSPGGSNTQVQFNNSSAFGGDAGLVYNSTTNTLTTDSLIINGVNINRLLRGLNGYNQFAGKDSMVVMAGAAVPTVNGDNTITWVTLFPGSGHNTYYVDTVRAGASSGFLHVKFPHVQRIVTWLAVPDDALANKGVFVGGSITLDSAVLNITKLCTLTGFAYGDGTSYTTSFNTPQTGGSGGAFSFSYDSGTGMHTFSNIPTVAINEPFAMTVNLATSQNWRIVWELSGLSNYQMKFKIYDNVSNTVITGAPTSDHKWFLAGPTAVCQVHAGLNSAGTDLSKNTFVSGSAIIFYGIGEK